MGRKTWRIVAKALGEKASPHNGEADLVAVVRLAILAGYMITNTVICAGVIRHWNDNEQTPQRLQLLQDSRRPGGHQG
ncbi:Rnf-Nqr [Synechococcus phage S-CBS2]|uniref:Rnf-Nqr n=1 Tax=Synechococcus phage S-CBS2 TaxID=753084 RepID=UPI000207843E|nr:Rnf-Nqr [Synechococcus phage S-CBS2]ADF42452.1 Rnf-Nqr [Synechococcus phage S-CBS2]